MAERRDARHLNRCAPPATRLADHEGVLPVMAVDVPAAGCAFTGRATRDRGNEGEVTTVERRRAWHFDRLAPRALLLAGHEGLGVLVVTAAVVAVVAADDAFTGRRTRNRDHAGPAAYRPHARHRDRS